VLGPAVLAGFIILVVAMPIQTVLGKRTGSIRRAAVAITDERVSIVNEILSAIKLIKLYAWEPSFARKVETVRAREISHIRSAAFINACNVVFGQVVPVVVTLITFAFHTLVLGNTLTSAQAFGTIALFNAAR
jgi:ABC-type bacteriocin/lantibiotic exporter with double-glycine peptidase domain